MVNELLKQIWKIIDLICYLAGFAFIAYAAFLVNLALFSLVMGIELLITGFLTELLSSKAGGEK